jgi:hypothetical protein
MPAINTVAISDGQATPVEHTYYPVQSSPIAVYREDITSLPVSGQSVLTEGLVSKGELFKFRVTLDLPVMEEASGANPSGYTAAPKVAHIVRADCTFFASKRSTSDQRNDLMELFMNSLADPQVRDSFKSLIKPY